MPSTTLEDRPPLAQQTASLKTSLTPLVVIAAVVLERDDAGEVTVKEHGGGLVAGGTTVGAVGGLVVGLFAPPLLLATVVGAAVGAGTGKLMKRHQEKAIGVEAVGSSTEEFSRILVSDIARAAQGHATGR